jgi:hypothetical protein
MRWSILWTAFILAPGADPNRLRTHTPLDAVFAEVFAGGSVAPSRVGGASSQAGGEARPAWPRAENGTDAVAETKTPVLRPAANAVEAAREAVEAVEGKARSNTTRNSTGAPVGGKIAEKLDGGKGVAETASGTNATENPDQTVDDAVKDAEQTPTGAPPQTKADAKKKKEEKKAAEEKDGNKTVVLATMKWIDEHLEMLGQKRENMKTSQKKTEATKKLAKMELDKKMDSKHSINVQYLQSLDYDRELSPASGKITVNGKEMDSQAVNDQVGLVDAVVKSDKTGKDERKNDTKNGTVGALLDDAESMLQREARIVSQLLGYHRRQRGRSVHLAGQRHVLLHGDMLLAPSQPYDWHLWPFGEVPYTLHPSIHPCGKSTLEAAIFDIEKHTCVRFKEISYDSAKDVIDNATSTSPLLFATSENDGCFAGIGFKKLYREHNVLNIGSGCEYPGIILHLLLHNLGLAHEQARYDRDLFINILWENMISEEEFKEQREGDLTGEFRVLKETNSSWEETSRYLEYDYGSITHFGRCEFSASAQEAVECEPSMENLVEGGGVLMGNRQQLTQKDITVINSIYGCVETCADGVQNQKEDKKDCGGPNCKDCGMPEFSKVSTSCPLASAWNRRMEASAVRVAVGLLLLLVAS